MWDPIAVAIVLVIVLALGFIAALGLVSVIDRHIQRAPRQAGDRAEDEALQRFLHR